MGLLEKEHIKVVAFDIDGTFYPLWKTHLRILRASIFHLPFALRYNKARKMMRTQDSFLDLPPLSKEDEIVRMAKLFYKKVDEKKIKRLEEKEKKVFFSSYEKSFLSIRPYKEVIPLLNRLKDEGYTLAIISDFPAGTKLKAMGIEEYFSFVLSAEECGRLKPCFTPFKVLSSSLGVKNEEILYIGDSLYKDAEGSARAGMKAIYIGSEEPSSRVTAKVHDWKELEEVLFRR